MKTEKIELNPQTQKQAIASIQQYFEENMDEPIGEMKAGLLLRFFLEEIGPVLYNKAVEDAQTRMQLRLSDLTGELYQDEFQYWTKNKKAKKNKEKNIANGGSQ